VRPHQLRHFGYPEAEKDCPIDWKSTMRHLLRYLKFWLGLLVVFVGVYVAASGSDRAELFRNFGMMETLALMSAILAFFAAFANGGGGSNWERKDEGINPSTGLPMVGSVDVSGNSYGSSDPHQH